jgi:hypothetical protein
MNQNPNLHVVLATIQSMSFLYDEQTRLDSVIIVIEQMNMKTAKRTTVTRVKCLAQDWLCKSEFTNNFQNKKTIVRKQVSITMSKYNLKV